MRRCPECGESVKEENLANHMGRVHPNVPRQMYGAMDIRERPRTVRRRPGWWKPVAAAVLAAVIVAGATFVVLRGFGGPGRFYADHTYYDLGHVPQSTTEHDFTFQNRGDGPLTIYGAQSSCGCTSARIVIDGQESPQFGMHENPVWTGHLAAGATAKLRVFYDAMEMPDLYVGDRSIYVRMDDPGVPEADFVIHVSEV